MSGSRRTRPAGGLALVLVGWGAIGARVAELLALRLAPVRLVGIGLRDGSAPPVGAGVGAAVPVVTDPAALTDLRPDLVVEAAGRGAVLPWGRAALESGADFCAASTSAFAREGVLDQLVSLARVQGRQVLIPPGALGGIDALAAASRLPLHSVVHEIAKPPLAWQGTPAAERCDLAALDEPTCFFEGSADQAAADYPQNANVALITALAGVGPDRTAIRLVADPGLALNRHRITATGDFGRMEVTLDNRTLADNPKSSELTALSLVRLIENRACALVV